MLVYPVNFMCVVLTAELRIGLELDLFSHFLLLSATLSPSHISLKSVDKLLSVIITPENHANFEELRQQARDIYLSGVDLDNKEEVARAYIKASV